MAPNRITRGRLVRRALLAVATATLLAAGLGACGGGGSSSSSEKERDVKVLNELLGRQLAVVETYEEVLPTLHRSDLSSVEQFPPPGTQEKQTPRERQR